MTIIIIIIIIISFPKAMQLCAPRIFYYALHMRLYFLYFYSTLNAHNSFSHVNFEIQLFLKIPCSFPCFDLCDSVLTVPKAINASVIYLLAQCNANII